MPKDNPIPSSVRFFVLHRDGFACRYCGRGVADGAILELDHIKPRAAGGANDVDNLCAACQGCNNGKRDKEGVNPPAGANDRQRAVTPGLSGKCFGELEGEEIVKVGIIRDHLFDDHVLIQYFDAFHGEPSHLRLVRAEFLETVMLFEDIAHMNAWLEAHDQ